MWRRSACTTCSPSVRVPWHGRSSMQSSTRWPSRSRTCSRCACASRTSTQRPPSRSRHALTMHSLCACDVLAMCMCLPHVHVLAMMCLPCPCACDVSTIPATPPRLLSYRLSLPGHPPRGGADGAAPQVEQEGEEPTGQASRGLPRPVRRARLRQEGR
jgi:hypothetical protein